jgi:hypothetical protein
MGDVARMKQVFRMATFWSWDSTSGDKLRLVRHYYYYYYYYYYYSRTSNNGHCRGIQILSVIGGVR